MNQNTKVFQIGDGPGRRLGDALARAGYLFRTVPHARFQARAEGVTATLYQSGKLVLQGRHLEEWAERFLPGGGAEVKRKQSHDRALPAPEVAAIGSDEAGKGDTFGPLVVCAVAWPEGGQPQLAEWGVADSKQLTDDRVRLLAPRIRERVMAEERCLTPAEYNQRHAAAGSNVNHLLTELHAELLEALHRRSGICLAVVDAFSARRPVAAALKEKLPALQIVEEPRAERHPAVAAASVLARARFVDALRALGEEWAVDLPLGSGTPIAPALRRFLEIHGPGKMGNVAKLHFRNVQKVLADQAGKR